VSKMTREERVKLILSSGRQWGKTTLYREESIIFLVTCMREVKYRRARLDKSRHKRKHNKMI